MLLTTCKLK